MPRHDYTCSACGGILLDQYRSVAEGASAHPPLCCSQAMSWIPQAAFDLRGDGEDPTGFQKFEIFDGQNRKVTIDSLHKLRQVERESEQQARNGEGQPLVFRAYSQTRSNRDVNTFGEGPMEKPTATGKRKFGLQGATKSLGETPSEATFGPAVNESNCSALPLAPD